MARPTRSRCRAVCQPGLEALLHAEMTALGLRPGRVTTGGVSFDASTRELYLANLWLRTATRVLVRVAQFDARHFNELEDGIAAIGWGTWLTRHQTVNYRVSSHGSRLFHTGAIEERVARIVDRPVASHRSEVDDLASGETPADEPRRPRRDARSGRDSRDRSANHEPANAGDPGESRDGVEQLIIVRIAHDEVTVSVDSSGEPLYKRGWRQQLSRAPLRETLAAAMLLGAGWDGTTPLVDPMCGSGTIVIEAALLARRVPPGVGRTFSFAGWPTFEPGTWGSVAGTARTAIRDAAGPDPSGHPVPIVGRDRDAGAIRASRANAERAGVADHLDLDEAPISALTAPLASATGAAPGAPGPAGWLLLNPPYGARVTGGHDLRDLYARFGDVARKRFPGWSVGILAADPSSGGHMGLALEPRWRSTNGGIEVTLLTGEVPRRSGRG